MTNNPGEVARIAAGLSEAMREMLTGLVRWNQGGCILCQGQWRTGEALERRGLTISLRALTPLGLAVRAHLNDALASPRAGEE